MSIRSIAVLLLRDAGVTSLAPAQTDDNANIRGTPSGLLAAVASAINGAFVEIFWSGPAALFERRASAVLYPPADITLDATQHSTAIAPAGFQDWMQGCTILIEGDPSENEILDAGGQLLRPYMGATGNHTARVWCDAVMLRSNEEIIVDTVQIRGAGMLSLCNFSFMQNVAPIAHATSGQYLTAAAQNKTVGQPGFYSVEARYTHAGASPSRAKFLRVAPKPDIAYPLDFRILASPPVFTVEAIDLGDHEVDPNVDPVVSWPELTLYAVARQQFSGDGKFTNEGGRPEIARLHQLVIKNLNQQDPQQEGVFAVWLNQGFKGRRFWDDRLYATSANRYRQ